jgi:hypothetical protein
MYDFNTSLFWAKTNDILDKMTPSSVDLNSYFISEKQTDIKKIVMQMFSSIQDYSYKPNIIKFWSYIETYKKILQIMQTESKWN